MLSLVPFDPRQQQVIDKHHGPQPEPPCTTERAAEVLADMHRSRRDIILAIAETAIPAALRTLDSMYPGTKAAVLAYAELADEHGPATVYRHLVSAIRERGL